MENFTPTDREPSEFTLHIIRAIAHAFPVGGQLPKESLHWN